MANSYLEYTGTGALQTLTVPDYIDRSHISVYVSGVVTTSFTWVTTSTIQLTATAGATIRVVRRSSPNARVTDYTDGVPLTEAALDADSKQAFFLAQEQLDATAEMLGVVNDLPATLSQMAAYEASCATSAANASSAATTAANAALAGKADKGSVNTSGLTMNSQRLLGRATAGVGAVEEITSPNIYDGTANTQANNDRSTKVATTAQAGFNAPAGAVMQFAMNTAPSGWLKCNGAAVSRTTYANLFTAIGTTFGVGDGSTTFNLPDLRGEFVRGWDDARGVDSGRGFGTAQGDLLEDHRHPNGLVLGGSGAGGNGGTWVSTATDTGLVSTAGVAGTETRPRNVALLYCIRT